jgi:predicted nuclease of predicted toxin-antitoxin system
MRLFSDACIYKITEEAVIDWGHNVETARNVGLDNESNGNILAYSVNTGRVLLTRDMHFSNILLYPPYSHLGIIILRIPPAWINEVHSLLRGFLSITSQNEMLGTLAIIDRSKWRLRKA